MTCATVQRSRSDRVRWARLGNGDEPTSESSWRGIEFKELEARRKLIFDIQRYAAEQQYYVDLYSVGLTGSWRPYVKNYAPSPSFDYGNRAAALWLDR